MSKVIILCFLCFFLKIDAEEKYDFFDLTSFQERLVYDLKDPNKIKYQRPERIEKEIWEQVENYLLPNKHPIKRKLDKLFSKKQTNKNALTLLEAGFRFPPQRTLQNIIVARHPELTGYIIKTFADDQPRENGWINFLARVRGAELIREAIRIKGYDKIFSAPQKWIYPIPHNNTHNVGNFFLLVAEDMELVSHKNNKKKWQNKISKDTLDALYDITESLGLVDSLYTFNIPFTKEGKISFIDTEHSLKWPVPYHKFNKVLSDRNRDYWITITKQ